MLPRSAADAEGLQNVVSYIADHYAFDIPLERLASIACMSETKLKGCFKRQFGCSITQYIQGRRMSQAEHLLINTDFTMGADRADDQLHDLQPFCRAVQKKHGHPADRVPEDRT